MSLERLNGPRSEVFTTALWDGAFAIADWPLHLKRLSEHAKLLRIKLPENLSQQMESLLKQESASKQTTQNHNPGLLLKIKCSKSGEVSVDSRPIDFRNEEIDAVTVEAPRWSAKVNGTKHGDWQAYIDARNNAEEKGVDVAFLVHDYAIVDADRAIPVVLDEDGVAWVAAHNEGGVRSITFEILSQKLQDAGIPIQFGRLNERLVARAAEIITLGSGTGACRILSLDDELLGGGDMLSSLCQALLQQHYQNNETWSDVRSFK
jgi:branched-subunit amino acid aminotransferase/4-amino-4-deoxychorismate lyase